MTNLSSIAGIGKSSLELLEAAGFSSAEALANAGAGELTAELKRANGILQIAKRAPERAKVAKWISAARDLVGVAQDAPEEVRMPVDYEKAADVAVLLEAAPFAIPLPAKILMDQQLAVADIPAAILLNRYSGDLEVKVDERVPAPKPGRALANAQNVRIAESTGSRLEIDSTRVRPTDVLSGPAVRKPSVVKMAHEDERIALIRSPRVETNKGRNPQSRRYIRGVLHSHPVSLTLGALVTMVLWLLLPVAIISAGLLMLSREVPENFGWVPEWLLAFPVVLPLVGLAWLLWGMTGSCRVCGQRLFVPRMCLKNSKAHHFPGLGHILPLCFHILLFRWFRCTYCGTPIRLKK